MEREEKTQKPGTREVKIVSWNVGLRGLRGTAKLFGGMEGMARSLGADILCLQEVKLPRTCTQLSSADTEHIPGYVAFFSLPRKGMAYSGVVTYCRTECMPAKAEVGFSGRLFDMDQRLQRAGHRHRILPYTDEPTGAGTDLTVFPLVELDGEGRCVVTDHTSFVLLNVYFPASRCGARGAFKTQFHRAVEQRCRVLQAAGRRVVMVGDFNVSHRRIDHCDPGSWERETGAKFHTSPYRQWMTHLVAPTHHADDGNGSGSGSETETTTEATTIPLLDMLRHWHGSKKGLFTWWDTRTGARANNYGCRLDYAVADARLVRAGQVGRCDIAPDVKGSDHCPVILHVTMSPFPSPSPPPPLATLPKINQRKLSTFFQAKATSTQPTPTPTPTAAAVSRSLAVSHSTSTSTGTATGNLTTKTTSPRKQPRNSKLTASPGRQRRRTPPRSRSTPTKSNQRSIASFFGVGRAPTAPASKATGRSTSSLPASKQARIRPRPPAMTTADMQGNTAKRSRVSGTTIKATATATATAKANANTNAKDKTTVAATIVDHDPRAGMAAARAVSASLAWRKMLSGPLPPPSCRCGERAVKRKVLKPGPNLGKVFYVCARPEGKPGTPGARCEFFMWGARHRAQNAKAGNKSHRKR